MKRVKEISVTPSSGNVFLDLGFAPERAERMKALSDAEIAGERALTGALMDGIAAWVAGRGLDAAEAARELEVPVARIEAVLRRRTGECGVDDLVRLLARTGGRVRVVVER